MLRLNCVIAIASTLALGPPTASSASGSDCGHGEVEYVSDVAAHRAPSATEDLRRLLQSEVAAIPDMSLRQRVLDAFEGKLCSADPDLLAVMIRFTTMSEPVLRTEASFLLRYFSSPSAARAVRGALADESPVVRMAALASVSYRHDVGALSAVSCISSRDPDREVKRYSRKVLSILKKDEKSGP